MAQSLTPWMENSICQGLNGLKEGFEDPPVKERINVAGDEEDGENDDGDDDSSFQKGSKVQIIRFLGFNGSNNQQGTQKEVPLWAIVSDKQYWVTVRFSKECVEAFDRLHTRNLLSMRGSIIALRWFRPSACLKAAQLYALESDLQATGPFSKVRLTPRLYLQVEAIHLWGSINEATFWETHDLQSHLMNEEVEEGMASRIKFRKWLAEMKRKQFSTTKRVINSASILTNSNRISSLSESGPEPYQQPKQIHRDSVPSKETDSNIDQEGSWGDFSLSWADDDYGLQNGSYDFLKESDENERDLSDPLAFVQSSNLSSNVIQADFNNVQIQHKRKRSSETKELPLDNVVKRTWESGGMEEEKKDSEKFDDNSWLNLLSAEE